MDEKELVKVEAQPVQPNEPDDDEEGDFVEPSKLDSVLNHLETDKGHAIATKVADAFTKYVDAATEVAKKAPSLTFKRTVLVVSVQFIVFLAALVVVVYLSQRGQIDPTLALLIGTVVGYFFGYGRRQS